MKRGNAIFNKGIRVLIYLMVKARIAISSPTFLNSFFVLAQARPASCKFKSLSPLAFLHKSLKYIEFSFHALKIAKTKINVQQDLPLYKKVGYG